MKRIIPVLCALALMACGSSGNSESLPTPPASGGYFSATTFAVREVSSLNGVDVSGRGILLSIEQANWQTTYAGIATLWMRDDAGCKEVYYLNSDVDVTAGGVAGNLSGDWVAGGPCHLPTGRRNALTLPDVRGTLAVDTGGTGATLTLTHPYQRTIVATTGDTDWLVMRVVSDTAGAEASLYESYLLSGTPVSQITTQTLPWQTIFAVGSGNHYFVSATSVGDVTSFTASGTLNGLCIGAETGVNPSFTYEAP